ncbi:MAG: uncharacterized protein K0R91_700, partial [Nitrososphaeraceae archaeon]|nr:uncharacterized protein [Nitrososphaeraceae archaeon]
MNSSETGGYVSPQIEYFLAREGDDCSLARNSKQRSGLKKEELSKLLKIIEREILRERTPDLQELAQNIAGEWLREHFSTEDSVQSSRPQQLNSSSEPGLTSMSAGESIVTELIERGYLKDSH